MNTVDAMLRATGAMDSLLRRPATHLLYLHHVPDLAWFEELLDGLQRRFVFVDPDLAFSRIAGAEHPEPAVSFSFDDGFVSAGTAASRLAARDVRCVQYVCPALVGRGDARVAALLGRQQPEGVMDWADLGNLADDGHVIASHTRRHRDLSTCSASELEDEIHGAREDLTRRLGRCEHFAWPFGRPRHFSAEAHRVARAAGYRTIASAVRGSHTPERSGVHLRHVIHPGQRLGDVETFLCLAMLGSDGHAAERHWVHALEPPGAAS